MVIVQNDVGNKHSPTVIVSAITSKTNKTRLPTHIEVIADENGLNRNSIVLLEQVRTIDKTRLREKMGHFGKDVMDRINGAIEISLGLQ